MSDFVEKRMIFDGIPVHYVEGGRGFPIVLIHGSGPGAASKGAWPLVLEPLAKSFRVFAMDLVGFGLSGRKAGPPYFDVPLWVRQCHAFVAHIGAPAVGIVGHSLAGALAFKAATTNAAITHVLTTCTGGGTNRLGKELEHIWTFPKNREALRKAAGHLVYDQTIITDEYLKKREDVLFSGDYAEYFGSMFSGNKQQYMDQSVVTKEELSRVRCEVTMMHGRDDLVVPPEVTTTMAAALPQADVILISRCKHSIAVEHPQKLIAAAQLLFPKLGS
jgi:2-hydroxymuconate-semialdehyde hydrolase